VNPYTYAENRARRRGTGTSRKSLSVITDPTAASPSPASGGLWTARAGAQSGQTFGCRTLMPRAAASSARGGMGRTAGRFGDELRAPRESQSVRNPGGLGSRRRGDGSDRAGQDRGEKASTASRPLLIFFMPGGCTPRTGMCARHGTHPLERVKTPDRLTGGTRGRVRPHLPRRGRPPGRRRRLRPGSASAASRCGLPQPGQGGVCRTWRRYRSTTLMPRRRPQGGRRSPLRRRRPIERRLHHRAEAGGLIRQDVLAVPAPYGR
jgi:hypothetical protein